MNSPDKLKAACLLGMAGQEAEGKGSQNKKWILKPKSHAIKQKNRETESEEFDMGHEKLFLLPVV